MRLSTKSCFERALLRQYIFDCHFTIKNAALRFSFERMTVSIVLNEMKRRTQKPVQCGAIIRACGDLFISFNENV